MTNFKSAEDFENPLHWDAYTLAVFANRLNPGVRIDHATETVMGFFHVLLSLPEEPTPEMFVELADEMLEGPSVSRSTH